MKIKYAIRITAYCVDGTHSTKCVYFGATSKPLELVKLGSRSASFVSVTSVGMSAA